MISVNLHSRTKYSILFPVFHSCSLTTPKKLWKKNFLKCIWVCCIVDCQLELYARWQVIYGWWILFFTFQTLYCVKCLIKLWRGSFRMVSWVELVLVCAFKFYSVVWSTNLKPKKPGGSISINNETKNSVLEVLQCDNRGINILNHRKTGSGLVKKVVWYQQHLLRYTGVFTGP